MSEWERIATLNSQVQQMQSAYETFVDDRQVERYHMQETIDSLNQSLWETEAALGDAERDLFMTKNFAIAAIRKLGAAIRERDELQAKLEDAEQAKAEQMSRIESMQRHLISLSRRLRTTARKTSSPCGAEEVEGGWTVVSPKS